MSCFIKATKAADNNNYIFLNNIWNDRKGLFSVCRLEVSSPRYVEFNISEIILINFYLEMFLRIN